METFELVIFLAVSGIAILAAVMMLLSENAVHSALFLILNFACVAFLYLMLNAAFLAMVQLAVYAGAIMVLFMFVIMLLGAERVMPEPKPRFPWLSRVGVALTMAFLVIAGIAILEANIESSAPEPLAPAVRVVNAAPNFEAVDVMLGDTLLADDLALYESSEFVAWETGEFDLHLAAGGTHESSDPLESVLLVAHSPYEDMDLVEATVDRLTSGEVDPALVLEEFDPVLELRGGEALTLVLSALPDGRYGFIPVLQDLSSFGNDRFARVQVVHAYPEAAGVDIADITQVDDEPFVRVDNLEFGDVSESLDISADDYRFGLYPVGVIDAALAAAPAGEEVTVGDVDAVMRLAEDDYERDTNTLLVVAPPRQINADVQTPNVIQVHSDNLPAFGSPTSVGYELFTTYMLPFQVIALLLLVAMIGAIVMTRDAVPPPKPRHPRRLANVSGNPVVGED